MSYLNPNRAEFISKNNNHIEIPELEWVFVFDDYEVFLEDYPYEFLYKNLIKALAKKLGADYISIDWSNKYKWLVKFYKNNPDSIDWIK